jgi:hypothetical protein
VRIGRLLACRGSWLCSLDAEQTADVGDGVNH